MSVPGIVQSTLDGEEIAARVSLGGDDELYVTPSSTLVYRADGLLSDESVNAFPHKADRLTLSEGRRKTRFALEYSYEGTKDFAVPAEKTEAVLHPVVAGVLNGNGITESGETVVQTYRFGELTVIVTSERLVKHVGEAVWDEDYEELHYQNVTGLGFEEGSVATQIVLLVDDRPHRIKAPNERAGDLIERLKRALFAYHDVSSVDELNALFDVEDPVTDFGESGAPVETETAVAGPESYEDGAQVSEQPVEASHAAVDATNSVDDGSNSGVRTEAVPSEGQSTASGASAGAGSVPPADVPGESATGNPVEAGFADSGGGSMGRTVDEDVRERLETLETAVERQTSLIESQQETIEQLITELRQGR